MGIFGRKKTTVGLDIGSAFVKLVEIDHMGDRPELRRIMSRPIPPGAVVDGEVTNRELLSDAVRALLEAAALQSRDVITALGGHDVFVKKVELTRVPHVSVRDLIAREAQRRVPFDLQSVHLDYQTLGPTPRMGAWRRCSLPPRRSACRRASHCWKMPVPQPHCSMWRRSRSAMLCVTTTAVRPKVSWPS